MRIVASGHRKIREPFSDPGPTKLAATTSKFCPHCRRKRRRRFEYSIPLPREEWSDDFPERQPRVSAREAWWNIGPVHWLVAPPQDGPWFRCFEFAECPKCGIERVRENDYIRQFGRLRLVVLVLERHISLKSFLLAI